MAKYNWPELVKIAENLAPECQTWTELAESISAHLGKRINRRTLTQGLERELGTKLANYEQYLNLVVPARSGLSQLASSLLDILRSRGREVPLSLLNLSERLDRAPSRILAAAEQLRDACYNIQIIDDREISLPGVVPPSHQRIPLDEWSSPAQIHRYGVIADLHLCNRNERLDVLEALYDLFEQEGITTVLLAGNLVDGEFKYNAHELLAHGVEGQIAYAANHYPQHDGIVTQFISADDHEGWWSQSIGLDIGRYMSLSFEKLGRGDLQWLGHVEVDLELHPDNPQAVLRLMHPGGGTSYAISYQPQKHVESWQGGEKPSVAIFGHYHKYGVFYPREVWTMLAGCVSDQSMFMRKRKLAAHVGGSIVEIHLSSIGGVLRVKHEWFPFYDKGYYASWDYASMFKE